MVKAKSYERLLGRTRFSDAQLKAHFKLYEGYVNKLNEILARLKTADRTSANYSFGGYSELKRREPIAYNGTLLHEFYFDAMGQSQSSGPPASVKKRIIESYGTWARWLADMKAAASSAHGWVLLVYDPSDKKLKTNLVHSEHHVGLFANARVILALDLWEHAYVIQFGIKKPDYLEAFFDSLNWNIVETRLSALI